MNQPAPLSPQLSAVATPQPAQAAAVVLAIASWGASLTVLILGPLLVFLHFAMPHMRLHFWWISFAAVLALALGAVLGAQSALPPLRQGLRRGGAVACLVIGYILFGLACCAMLFCSVAMWLILGSDASERAHFRSGPLGEPQLSERKSQELASRKQEIAALRKNIEQQQDELQKAHDARVLARQQAAAAAMKKAEEARRQKFASSQAARKSRPPRPARAPLVDTTRPYRDAMLNRLTQPTDQQPNQQPLPEYPGAVGELTSGHKVDWRTGGMKFPDVSHTSMPEQKVIADEPFTEQGLQIRQLKFVGEQFVTRAYVKSYQGVSHIWLLQKNGKLIQFSTSTWKCWMQQDLKQPCSEMVAGGGGREGGAYAIGTDQVIRMMLENGHTFVTSQAFKSPQQLIVDEEQNISLVTGGQVPLLVTWKKKELTKIQELSRARLPTEVSGFLPSQHGQQFAISPKGEIFVTRHDGIYRGQLPANEMPQVTFLPGMSVVDSGKHRRRWFFSAQVGLDGREIVSPTRRWPLERVQWQKVLPATGIDLEKFAPLNFERLATCNQDHNLMIYDALGKLISTHDWPDAGPTLGIAPLLHLSAAVVFTEKQIYVVSTDFRVTADPIQP